MFVSFTTLAGADLVAPGDEACAVHCAGGPATPSAKPAAEDLAAHWGIEVSALRLSAKGNLVDFRYRVIDPAKAAILGSTQIKPVLIDQTSGAELHVPSMPKVGPLRSTAQRLVAGKIYTALFSNPGLRVKKGHNVTIVFGDFRAENLTVGE